MSSSSSHYDSEEGTLHQASQNLSWPITEASREGDLERVKLLVDQWRRLYDPSNLLDTGAKIDPEVIVYATYGTSEAFWQAFLDRGWDINSNCGTGAPVLKHLDPNIHGAKNECPLNTAANVGNFAVVDLLLQHGAKIGYNNALHAVAGACKGDSECIPMMAYLLDHGANVNALERQSNPEYCERMKSHPSISMETALHCAAYRGSKERVQFLLDRGADPQLRDSPNFTAADSVNEYDETGIAELLENWTTTRP
ncbi:MAG: hypothetical protein FRX48_05649 [Lasallia pustulata]|uniref:Uncharacterized protein n=1 Tax=Lasallia pustulata TaxID=136370 RepID=A0A5M8PMK5_9LECA|nr:MAG: hypothetical protein FRX48_05649 [Lasallia pustulata]